jgi:hypothetical protein
MRARASCSRTKSARYSGWVHQSLEGPQEGEVYNNLATKVVERLFAHVTTNMFPAASNTSASPPSPAKLVAFEAASSFADHCPFVT